MANNIQGFGSSHVGYEIKSKILNCQCGNKYIKTRDGQNNCLICTRMEVPRIVCKKCGRYDIRLNRKKKTVHGLCTPCDKIRVKEYNTKYVFKRRKENREMLAV